MGTCCNADTPECRGCEEAGSPWDTASAVRNQVLMSLPVAVGALALWKYRARKLLVYVPAAVYFMTGWRKYICARCQYYGTECSTMLGVATARMMPRDETKQLDRNAMTADLAYIGALVALPLRQVLKSPRLAAIYFAASIGGMASVLFTSCGRCGNEFCPMKDLYRVLK
jgi:hypothetical protein